MKTIALMDFHQEGHHYAFTRLFAKYLLRLGYRVCIFFPNRHKEIQAYLIDAGARKEDFSFFPFHIKVPSFTKLGRFNAAIRSLILWYETKKTIKRAEYTLKIKIDLVFLSWLDEYLANYLPHQLVNLVFSHKWSGLYFHPWYAYEPGTTHVISLSSVDSALRSKYCISIGVHDEFLIDKIHSRTNKPVIFFPEIADSSPPDLNYDLARRIKEFSKNRIIVGLIGLSKRKGTLQMVQLAMKANETSFFFLFAGHIPWTEYTSEEQAILNNFFTSLPPNCYYHDSSVEEGPKINALICTIDILYLVYFNFKSSSNFITKAAHFKKIVLATDRYWIGRVTKKYNMGRVVDENDTDEILDALSALRQNIIQENWDFSKYTEYLNIHEEERLTHAFEKVFEK